VRFLDRLQPLALFVMRLALGAVVVGDGYQKLFRGLHHYSQFLASHGLPAWLAYVSASIEFFGGALVILGLFTRCAAFAICVDLCAGIAKVSFHNGFGGDHGYAFPLALASIAFALIFFGGGPMAFDHIRAPGGAARMK
jgi:putative oxidoreductase